MATNFPTSVDTLTNPTSTDGQDNPPHDTQHANANDAIEALETALGTTENPREHSATAKTTPADNDEIGLVDSAASFVLKKLSFLNLKIAVLKAVYPVGSVYVNATDATSPATLLGFGTWTAFGAGRVMVGQDTGDTDFDTLEETRGSKILQQHSHKVNPPATNTGNQSANHSHLAGYSTGSKGFAIPNGAFHDVLFSVNQTGSRNESSGDNSGNHLHSVDIAEFDSGNAGTGTAGNIQPSIVVKMWKRTA